MTGGVIRDDFNRLIHDSGALARQTANRARYATSDAAHSAVDGVRHTLDRSRDGLARGYQIAGNSIRENPMHAILIAGAVGFLIGVAALAACTERRPRRDEGAGDDERG